MSRAAYTPSVLQTGIDQLQLLGRHASSLLQAYSRGQLDEQALPETTVQQLLQARVIWRDDDQGQLRIGHNLRELIAGMIGDEQRRQTHTDVGETLSRLRTLVNRYRENHHRGRYYELDRIRLQLAEEVDDFNSRYSDNIDALWQKLNSDFGFVQNLEDKIAENRQAQEQAQRLLNGLLLIDFDEWAQLAGSHAFLRRLLVSRWHRHVSQHYSSLRTVQERLLQLVTRFRQQQASTRLVRSMAHFLRWQTEYQPQDYARQSRVPELLNLATPVPVAAALSLHSQADQDVLGQIFARLPKRAQTHPLPPAAQAVTQPPVQTVAPMQQAIKKAAVGFFDQVLADTDKVHSAMAHYQAQAFEWPAEIWLYQIAAVHEGYADAYRLEAVEETHTDNNQLRLIRDYEISFMADT